MQGTPVFKTNSLNPRRISPHFHVFVLAIANKNQTFHDENSHIYLCCPANLDFSLKGTSHSHIQLNHAGPLKHGERGRRDCRSMHGCSVTEKT